MRNVGRYVKDLAERAISSAAAAALATITATGISNLSDVNWRLVAGVAGLAALVSLLKGLVAANVGDPSSASLVDLRQP